MLSAEYISIWVLLVSLFTEVKRPKPQNVSALSELQGRN